MERREGRAAFRLLRPRRAAESHVRRIQTCATSLCGMTLRTALTVLLAVGLMPLWGEAPGIELAQAGEPGEAQGFWCMDSEIMKKYSDTMLEVLSMA